MKKHECSFSCKFNFVAGEMILVEKMEKEVVAMYKHDAKHRTLEALAPLKRLFGRRNVCFLLFMEKCN